MAGKQRRGMGGGAMRAFRWFLGDNDLAVPLVDPATGACSDGLHPDRSSENKGAELVLSYLLGLSEIRRFVRAGVGPDRAEAASAPRRSAPDLSNRNAKDLRGLFVNPCS